VQSSGKGAVYITHKNIKVLADIPIKGFIRIRSILHTQCDTVICVATHRRMSPIADSTSVLCVYASARMNRHPVITIPLIDRLACVYASTRIESAGLAAPRRDRSRRVVDLIYGGACGAVF